MWMLWKVLINNKLLFDPDIIPRAGLPPTAVTNLNLAVTVDMC